LFRFSKFGSKPGRVIRQAVTCWALYSSCLSVLRNPNNVAHLAALGAFCAVPNGDYAFLSPGFLLFAKIFFPDFLLIVQVVRTDDLHRLQFLTIPALNEHIYFFLLVVSFEKIQLFDRFSPEDKRNSSGREGLPS